MSDPIQSSFMNEDSVKANTTVVQFIKKLIPYLKRHQILSISVLFVVFAQTATSRLMPTVIGRIVDLGIIKKDTEYILMMTYVYFGLELVKSLFSFLNVFLFQKLGNRVLYYLREDLTKHILKLPMDFFNKTPSGRIVTRMTNDISALGDLFSEGIIAVFTNFIMLIGILISMALISWKLTLAIVVLTPGFVFFSILIGRKIKVILTESKKLSAKLNAFIAENFSGIRTVQLFGREKKHLGKFKLISDSYKNTVFKSTHFYALLYPIMNFFGAITVALTLIYGGYLRSQNLLEVGLLVAFFLHVQDFVHPLREIIEKYQQFQNSLTSADRIFSLLQEQEEVYSGDPISANSSLGRIDIKNLNFSYDVNSAPDTILKNINLTILPGQKVAFVGRTGSGKSTLISLLQRFYEPASQTIFIDGKAIETIDKGLLRKYIGSIQQDPFLFKGSIFENITLGDPSISIERVQKAAEQIGLIPLLNKSARDLNSLVEERGSNLSLGEKQLVAFTRILAFDPHIIILDEATANVDSETEAIIQKATDEITKNRTSIVIAHRLSTIESSDLIFVLQNGVLIEQGNHIDLLKAEGPYFEMHQGHSLVSKGI